MKRHIISIQFVAFICLTLYLTGCENQESAWGKAKSENSISEYQRFIKKHPSSIYIENANIAMDSLIWISKLSTKKQNLDSLDSYLNKSLSSKYFQKYKYAKDSIEWILASISRDRDRLNKYISDYPKSKNIQKAEAIIKEEHLIDAVDLLVATFVLNMGNSTGFGNVSPPKLSHEELTRLKSLGKVSCDFTMGGIRSNMDASSNDVSPDGYLSAKLSGPINYKIKIGQGSFGVSNEKIYISSGTKITIDNIDYEYTGGCLKVIK